VLFAFIIGLAIWGEQPDLASILGAGLIVGAALLNRRTR